MKILKVNPSITYYVETDDPEFGGMYRRGGSEDTWERLMGDSWEPVYFAQPELEELFQKYIAEGYF